MKKLLLTFAVLVGFVSLNAQSLSQDIAAAKADLKSNHQEFRTGVIKWQEDAQKISVDIAGWDKISIRSWGSEDGISYDQSAWGEATFIKGDGTTVKLSQMKYLYANTRYGTPKRNTGFENGDIIMNGVTYSHGVAMHSEAEIVIDIAGEGYTTFESWVGLEDSGSPRSSVIFIVQNMSPRSKFEELMAAYPSEISAFTTLGRVDPEAWMAGEDGAYEKMAALNAAKSIRGNDYYTSIVEAVDGTLNERVEAYIGVVAEIQRINDIVNRLKFVDVANVRRAFEDMKSAQGYPADKYEAKMAQLEALAKGKLELYKGDKEAIATAERILSLSREILLSNSALDGDKIILGRYKIGSQGRSASAPLLGTQPNNWSNQMSAVRLGFDAQIAQMSNLRDEKPTFEQIYKPEIDAPVSDLMLHWDADRILFTSIGESGLWNIFQVGVDGEGVREVIKCEEPDLEFADATFLPNGKFIATSNIGYNAVPCVNGTDPVGNMVLFDPEDNSLRRITFDQDANWHPVVTNNGKVMYVRWEYTDLTHYFSRITMHMNPDGTEQKALYGSGAYFPNSTFDIQPLPGNSSRFIAIASGHHGVARSGRLMLIDPAKSRKRLEGIVQEIPFSTREIKPIIKDGLVNGVWPQFIKPRPVTDKYFLVTAKLTQQSLWGIYLVDIFDNMTLIAECEGEGLISPIYLQKLATPPVIPDKVDLTSTESTVYIQDIYEGEGLPGVARGAVKKLRLFAYEYAYIRSPSNHLAQGIQSGWDIKRLLGEVDVNPDGSAIFKVPANTPISIQPLDSLGQAVQWMRSWFTGMPGEVVSCVGCHEDQNTIAKSQLSMASRQSPQSITSWEGGARPFTYELEVQPVLDRACIACHNADSKLDFRGGIYDEGLGRNGFLHPEIPLSKSYLNLHPYVNRQGPEADILVMKPYEYHASTSELIRLLRDGHKGVELTDHEWQVLYAWIDLNAPFHGIFLQNDINGYNQIDRRQQLARKYANVDVNWKGEIEDYAALLASKGETQAVMPDYKAPTYKEAKSKKGWPFSSAQAQAMQAELGESRMEVELGEGVVMVFRRVPAGHFIMGSSAQGGVSAPESRVTIKKPFWIGEIEVTNKQYNALIPEHDSRYMARMWKDLTTQGYVANSPDQPVIRISYNDAVEYCRKLSELSGLNVTLPTEAQWEWAARAGSQDDFWFGELGCDFAKYENMGDVQLENYSGMKPNNQFFKYYNYLPKQESVDDGQMIQTACGSYEANPWGLYDMLGNVRELTSSDYLPYPYKGKSVENSASKVVRGGSWIDRPNSSTAYSRKSVAPWQPSNNVGFRVIIE